MSFKSNLEALILGALRDGPLHGYAIAKTIEQKGAGALRMGENQLYPTLHRLEREGAVVAEWQPQENKPPRKVYSLTPSGQAELDRHRKSWSDYAAGVGSVLGLSAEVSRG